MELALLCCVLHRFFLLFLFLLPVTNYYLFYDILCSSIFCKQAESSFYIGTSCPYYLNYLLFTGFLTCGKLIIYYLLFNLHLFAYSFGFQKLLICFKLLFRHFDYCFIRDSFEGFCSNRFLCQVWSLNGDIFQVFTSGKCLCADGSNACWNNNFGQFLITPSLLLVQWMLPDISLRLQ